MKQFMLYPLCLRACISEVPRWIFKLWDSFESLCHPLWLSLYVYTLFWLLILSFKYTWRWWKKHRRHLEQRFYNCVRFGAKIRRPAQGCQFSRKGGKIQMCRISLPKLGPMRTLLKNACFNNQPVVRQHSDNNWTVIVHFDDDLTLKSYNNRVNCATIVQ